MCFVLYAGTAAQIPRREWRKDAPDLSVLSLTEHDTPMQVHFSHPEVQYIGSTSGCGCDFPHVTLHKGEWSIFDFEKNVEQLASDRYNREALVCLLRETGENVVELYGVWDGDFKETPKIHEDISLQTILDPNFFFKERGFYLARR